MPLIDGNRLLELRKEKKMTQEELAKSAYVSKQVISNIERGVTNSVNDYVLNLLSFSLMVRSEYLSRESNDPDRNDDGLLKVVYRLPEWDFIPDVRQVLTKYSDTREVEVLLRDIVFYLSQIEKNTAVRENEGVELLKLVVGILRNDKFKDITLLINIIKVFEANIAKKD